MDKPYLVLAEGTGLHARDLEIGTYLDPGAHVLLKDLGSITYSHQMWKKVKAKQEDLSYFSSEAELAEARKLGFRGGWNLPKASVVSVKAETVRKQVLNSSFPSTRLTIGYSLWAVDPFGYFKPMRVDYAAAAVSREELTANPAEMYTFKDGVYMKNSNDHANALGVITLVMLGVGSKPEDLEALLVRRGGGIDFLSGIWSAPSGYIEPEYRLKIGRKFLEGNAKTEILQEAGINRDEVDIYPAGFSQGDVETAMVYIGFSRLTAKEVLERKVNSETERRLAVPIKEYDYVIAGLNIEPESLGALEGIFGSGKLLEMYVKPYVEYMRKK